MMQNSGARKSMLTCLERPPTSVILRALPGRAAYKHCPGVTGRKNQAALTPGYDSQHRSAVFGHGFSKTVASGQTQWSVASGQRGSRRKKRERLEHLSENQWSVVRNGNRRPSAKQAMNRQKPMNALSTFQIRRHLARWQRTVLLAED
jgi:hypothetical protein